MTDRLTDIPEPVIRRHFSAGRENFARYYRPLVDDWILFDNSGDALQPVDWEENHA